MLTSPSLGFVPNDIYTLRAIEQLAFLVGDVEQRLNVVRSTLAQISPGFVTPRIGLDRTLGFPGIHTGLLHGVPNVGAPIWPTPSLAGLPVGGINAPVAYPNLVPNAPFRF